MAKLSGPSPAPSTSRYLRLRAVSEQQSLARNSEYVHRLAVNDLKAPAERFSNGQRLRAITRHHRVGCGSHSDIASGSSKRKMSKPNSAAFSAAGSMSTPALGRVPIRCGAFDDEECARLERACQRRHGRTFVRAGWHVNQCLQIPLGGAVVEVRDRTFHRAHRQATLAGVCACDRESLLGDVEPGDGPAVLLGVWLLRAPGARPELRVAEITTARTSNLSSFALSSDGRRLALVADREGQPALRVRELDSAEAHSLPGTERARRPFWSPDSLSIGFFRDSELKRIDTRGGSAQTVTYLLAGTTAAWGSNGTILFSSAASPTLRRVSAAGGTIEDVTAPTTESSGHLHPHFLPGGQEFLSFVGGRDAVRGVYLGSLDSSRVSRLVPSDTQGAYMAPGWLLFIRQGTLWAQRFDLERRSISGEPLAVADSVASEPLDGTGAFSTSDAGVLGVVRRDLTPANVRSRRTVG